MTTIKKNRISIEIPKNLIKHIDPVDEQQKKKHTFIEFIAGVLMQFYKLH